ncbi:MAG TPA: nitrate- and nitrite sensing domain-containing protein [Pseudonocardiaceae bacterium]|nr:nitrate- and nitrite sensing domain-containing protein [Pseudonocardiaceae bacterium]
MAGPKVRARPPTGRPAGRGEALRAGITALRCGSMPAAMFGATAPTLPHRGSRWRLRDWRLRTKLTAVLLLPLLLAGVLGALRVTDLVRKANASAALARQVGFAQQLGIVVHDLQAERYQVAAMQASARLADRAVLQTQVARVDSAVKLLRAADTAAETFPVAARAEWRPVHRAAMSRLSGLAALRRAVLPPAAAPGVASARTAVSAYSALIAMLLDLERQALGDAPEELDRKADAAQALAAAEEQASREHVILQTGIFADGLSPEQQAALRAADARLDAAADEFTQATSPGQRQLYFGAGAVLDRKRLLDAALDRAVRAAPLETVPGDWNSAAAGTVETIWQGQTALLGELRTATAVRGGQALREAYWCGGMVVLLLLLAVGLCIVVLRSLLQPLRALRTAAFEVADRRLPEAIEQLRSADGPPGETTVDPVPVHSREEVGQVARAFDTVHVQAVRLAAEQAQLRSSLNDVFLTLSRRNRGLLQRQRQLIDEARRDAVDAELADRLRQLDQLTTRMCRYSDNLLAVAGGTQHRGSEDSAEGQPPPATVLDVLTHAVSEIEDQTRVTVCPPPAARIAGPVATDLTHLIAELLDNAVTASPPGASVTLGGTLTEDNGLLLEITDSGPGLSRDLLQAINARLASAPAVDPLVAGQTGLFIARELAAQQNITVRLRQRLGSSGTTATVLLPASLVTVDLRASTAPPEPEVPTAARTAVTAEGSGSPEYLPLQVSVSAETTGTDLFSPASISPASRAAVTSPGDHPRTAQEEWSELFGSPPDLASEHGPAGDWAAASAELNGMPSAARAPEVREEIFEMVSAWFRERRSGGVATVPPEWQSPLDEGWQAAQALHSPMDHELTGAGLPKRQPRAHLVSGADDVVAPPQRTGPVRTPEDVRGRLSRYQRGLRVGRHARSDPAEHPSCTDTLPRPLAFEYRSFEE